MENEIKSLPRLNRETIRRYCEEHGMTKAKFYNTYNRHIARTTEQLKQIKDILELNEKVELEKKALIQAIKQKTERKNNKGKQ